MKVIYKYPLGYRNLFMQLQLPIGAEILSVQYQNEGMYLWAVVESRAVVELRSFYILGTGMEVPNHVNLKFIATVQQGAYVWHVFEEVK